MKKKSLLLLFCLITGGSSWLLQAYGVNDSLQSAFSTPIQQANLIIDLCAAFMVLLLPLWAARLACVIQYLLNILITSSLHFLTTPLSVAAMLSGWESFREMGADSFSYIYVPAVVLWAGVLAVQLLLLPHVRPDLPRSGRAAICLCLVMGLGVVLHSRIISERRQVQALNGNEIVLYFGYLPGWIVELGSGRTAELEAALAMPVCPRLPDTLPQVPFSDKIVFLQVECLDFGLLTQPGPYPMPFLQSMLARSVVFHVNGQKKLGSANSDYEWLTGCEASQNAMMYTVLPSVPPTLNQYLQNRGYTSRFFHGLTGDFMRLRSTYQKLGFTSVAFKEELRDAGCPVHEKRFMGQVSDGDLLAYAARFLNEPGPFMHFIVTVSMHSDKDFPVPEDLAGLKHAGYFAAARHFDDALRHYVAAMPEDVTLLIIGDHTSYFEPRSHYVPAIMFRKDRNLARYASGELPHLSRCQWGIWLRRNLNMPLPEIYAMENPDQSVQWAAQESGLLNSDN